MSALWGALSSKVSISMSNVPGPQFPVKFGEATVADACFLVPPSATISILVVRCGV